MLGNSYFINLLGSKWYSENAAFNWALWLIAAVSHLSAEMVPSPLAFHHKSKVWGLPWRSSGWDSGLPQQGVRDQSLVGELRYCMLRGQKNKIKKNKNKIKKKIYIKKKKVWMKTIKRMRVRIMVADLSLHLEIPGCPLPTQVFPVSWKCFFLVTLTELCGCYLCQPPLKPWGLADVHPSNPMT